jgi:hypothetical protein
MEDDLKADIFPPRLQVTDYGVYSLGAFNCSGFETREERYDYISKDEHKAIARPLQAKVAEAEYEREAMASLWAESKTRLEAQLTKAEAENKKLVEALRTVFKIANPGASSNEWLCFKAAKEALMIQPAQEKE